MIAAAQTTGVKNGREVIREQTQALCTHTNTHTQTHAHTHNTYIPKHSTLPPHPLCGGVHVSESDWETASVLACPSALMRPQEVNEKASQPFIPITIVRPYSGR